MRDVIYLLFYLIAALASLAQPGGGRSVIAENLLLKQQLIIHSRSRQRAPNLTTQDRALLGFWSLFLNPRRIARSAIIIKPSTLLSFHHAIKKRNPRYGCPRIAQQINLAFGLELDKDVVRRILATHYKPEPSSLGPSWLTTIGHAKDSLWSVDLFRCESIKLKSHWVVVVMDQYTRRIIGFAVNAGNVDGPALCRMFNEATSGQGWPIHISSDNDPLFRYHRWKANLRVLEIEDIKSLPHVPMSHPFVERLIGSIRRELLDHTFFWTATDLENKLKDYQRYYNECRTHSGRNGETPAESDHRKVIDIKQYRWQRHCRGLFQLPMAA